MTNHSPLPWRKEHEALWPYLSDAAGVSVAVARPAETDDEAGWATARENRDLILLAVNYHAILKELVREAVPLLEATSHGESVPWLASAAAALLAVDTQVTPPWHADQLPAVIDVADGHEWVMLQALMLRAGVDVPSRDDAGDATSRRR